jgi:crotonobetainyl-CoA:carnitine CoA-transferase CaiB-like acyl-CoA transferase
VLSGAPVVDTIGALLAAQGVLTALLHRERTGQGKALDVSLLDGALLVELARLCVFFASGQELGRSGSAHPELTLFQAFATSAGWIYVAVWVEKLWRPFCAAIDGKSLADDLRFVTKAERCRHRDALVTDDPQVAANSTVLEQIHPSAGPIRTMSTPVRFRRTPGGIRTPAPILAQDTAAVFAQLGVDAVALDRLRRAGVIACTA